MHNALMHAHAHAHSHPHLHAHIHVHTHQVHTTFQYSGAVGKLHRLREAQLWEDPPEYFSPKRGLLAYVPRVRRDLIRPAGTMDVESHFTLVHDQLVQALYSLISISAI